MLINTIQIFLFVKVLYLLKINVLEKNKINTKYTK